MGSRLRPELVDDCRGARSRNHENDLPRLCCGASLRHGGADAPSLPEPGRWSLPPLPPEETFVLAPALQLWKSRHGRSEQLRKLPGRRRTELHRLSLGLVRLVLRNNLLLCNSFIHSFVPLPARSTHSSRS